MSRKIKDLAKSIFTSQVFLSSAMISLVTVATGFLNFLFNLIISNKLGSKQFGEIYPLISLWTIIVLPASAFQYLMSKDMSVFAHKKDWPTFKAYIRKLSLILAIFISLVLIGLLISLPALKSYFHISGNLPFLIVFTMVPVPIFISLFNSLIQSRERFHIYTINMVVSSVAKFIAGIGLVVMMANYLGALYGLLISQIISFLYLCMEYFRFQEIKPKFPAPSVKHDLMKSPRIIKIFLLALFSVGGFQLLNFMDSILVRHFLPEASGVYSVVNLLGKASFFIATGVSFVMLPKMAKDRENLARSNRRALFILLIILVLYALFLVFASRLISVYLFSNKYPGMENILPLYGFMFLPFAAISFLVNYYMVSENAFYSAAILIGAAVEAVLIGLFHKDLVQVSLAVGASGFLILGALLLDSIVLAKKKKPES